MSRFPLSALLRQRWVLLGWLGVVAMGVYADARLHALALEGAALELELGAELIARDIGSAARVLGSSARLLAASDSAPGCFARVTRSSELPRRESLASARDEREARRERLLQAFVSLGRSHSFIEVLRYVPRAAAPEHRGIDHGVAARRLSEGWATYDVDVLEPVGSPDDVLLHEAAGMAQGDGHVFVLDPPPNVLTPTRDALRMQALAPVHDRAGALCGVIVIDANLAKRVAQGANAERRGHSIFVSRADGRRLYHADGPQGPKLDFAGAAARTELSHVPRETRDVRPSERLLRLGNDQRVLLARSRARIDPLDPASDVYVGVAMGQDALAALLRRSRSTLLLIAGVVGLGFIGAALHAAAQEARRKLLQLRTLESAVAERQALAQRLQRRTRAEHVLWRMLRLAGAPYASESWALLLDELLELPDLARPGRARVYVLTPLERTHEMLSASPLRCVAAQGREPEALAGDALSPDLLAERAVSQGALVWQALASAHPQTPAAAAGCALPIRAGQRLLGVLYTDVRMDRISEAETRDQLELVSDLLASCIEHQHAVDEIARAREELERARRLDARATQAKDAFLVRVLHQLRTPLTAVLGFAELLGDDPHTDPDHREALDRILSNGAELRDRIDQLLGVSAIRGEALDADTLMAAEVGSAPESPAIADAPDEDSGAPAPAASVRSAARPLAQLRLLVAEDTEVNRLLLEHMLRNAGAHVLAVQDGRSAYEAARAAHDSEAAFHAILMDVQMPEMDGLEATALLREHGDLTPIIALTASDLDADHARCLAAGCDAVETKPIDRDRLFGKLLGAARLPKEI